MWVSKQYQMLDLPDKRLDKRCVEIVMGLVDKPCVRINQATNNWAQAKGAYRFIENDRVHADDLMAPLSDAAVKNCIGQDTILAVQDTITISFDSAKNAEGLGVI